MRKREISKMTDDQIQLILETHAKYPSMSAKDIIRFTQIPVSEATIGNVIRKGSTDGYKLYLEEQRCKRKKNKPEMFDRIEEHFDMQSILLRICVALEKMANAWESHDTTEKENLK